MIDNLMTDEEEYVLKSFLKNFEGLKHNKIVLYGTGAYTEIILKNVKNFNIAGIMDGFKDNGSFCGYNILDYEDVIKEKVEAIIIIARSNNTKVIYNRISDFCKKNNIIAFDIYGKDLIKSEKIFLEDNEYFLKNENELKILIDSNEAISFDIFDTLVMRKTLLPEDVFELMARQNSIKNFAKLRKEAETPGNLNIYEIYDNYQRNNKITDTEKKKLIEMELETEKSILVIRKKVVEILEYAINQGKKVYLISDMYLPKGILINILNDLGIKGYKDIFVSCDYKCLKSQGLFKKYKENVECNSYLHIGDSKEADEIAANINGISSYIIKSAYEMLEISSYREIVKLAKSFPERLMLGLFVEKAFNNPFELYESKGILKVKAAYDRSYLFLAPIITGFMIWLISEIKNIELDGMFFGARDGYLISKLYDKTIEITKEELPKGVYFLISRFAGCRACSTNEEDIKYFSSYSYIGKPEEMIKDRFFISPEEIVECHDSQDVENYTLKYKDKIIDVAKKMKNNYLKYIEKIGFLDKKNIGFFDFVSSGTCQMCLDKILKTKSTGFYFIHIISTYLEKRLLNIKALYKSGNAFELTSCLFDNYLFLEYVMASFEPTLSHFDGDGNPVFTKDDRTKEELETIKKMQNAIIDYFSIYLSNISSFESVSVEFVDRIFGFMNKKYSNICDELPEQVLLKGEFSNKKLVLNT